jgi:predicted permease
LRGFFNVVLEVLSVTVPIFAVIAIGFFLRRKEVIKAEASNAINKIAYYLGLPALIFASITRYSLSDIFDFRIIVTIYSTVLLFLFITVLLFFFLDVNRKTKGAMIVSSFRCNMAFMGFPVLLSAYGTIATAKASVIIAFMTPFNILFTIMVFRLFEVKEKKISRSRFITSILFDPIILASVLGILVSYFDIRVPVAIEGTVNIIAELAIPLALLSIGASFSFHHIRANIKLLTPVVVLKLVLMPFIAFVISYYLFRLDRLDTSIVTVLFAMPLAAAAYIMGAQFRSNSEFISSALIISTIFSSLTITIWLTVLRLI